MRSIILTILSFGVALATYSQADSANIFYQKALAEKQAGRKLEVWKNLDKAYKYNPNDKAIATELADVLMSLNKYVITHHCCTNNYLHFLLIQSGLMMRSFMRIN